MHPLDIAREVYPTCRVLTDSGRMSADRGIL